MKNKSVYVRNQQLYSDTEKYLSKYSLSMSEFLARCCVLVNTKVSVSKDIFFKELFNPAVIECARSYNVKKNHSN